MAPSVPESGDLDEDVSRAGAPAGHSWTAPVAPSETVSAGPSTRTSLKAAADSPAKAPAHPAVFYLRPTAELAERVLLPDDPGRALALAQTLIAAPRMFNHHRGLWGYTGLALADDRPLTIQATGMGGPSAAIVLTELIALGARRAIRVGTCRALSPELRLGDLVVASEAICRDGASRALLLARRSSAPEDRAGARVPAADPAGPRAPVEEPADRRAPFGEPAGPRAAADAGLTEGLASATTGPTRARVGPVVSVDLFYDELPEPGPSHHPPQTAPTRARVEAQTAQVQTALPTPQTAIPILADRPSPTDISTLARGPALAVEMEAAALFAVGAVTGISVGCVLAVAEVFDAAGARTRIADDPLLSVAQAMGDAAIAALGRTG